MGELDFRLMAAFSSLVSQAPPRDGSNALAGIKIDAELVVGLRVVEMLYSPNVSVSNMADLEVSLKICRPFLQLSCIHASQCLWANASLSR